MTSYVNLCTAKSGVISQRCQGHDICRRNIKLSEHSKPPRTNILHISDFHSGHLGSGQLRDLLIISKWGNTETDYFAMKMI